MQSIAQNMLCLDKFSWNYIFRLNVIIENLSPLIKTVDPGVLKLGKLKLRTRKLVKKLIRFLILSIVLVMIISLSKVLELHD